MKANQITRNGSSADGLTVVRRAWTGTIFVAGNPDRTQTIGYWPNWNRSIRVT